MNPVTPIQKLDVCTPDIIDCFLEVIPIDRQLADLGTTMESMSIKGRIKFCRITGMTNTHPSSYLSFFWMAFWPCI